MDKVYNRIDPRYFKVELLAEEIIAALSWVIGVDFEIVQTSDLRQVTVTFDDLTPAGDITTLDSTVAIHDETQPTQNEIDEAAKASDKADMIDRADAAIAALHQQETDSATDHAVASGTPTNAQLVAIIVNLLDRESARIVNQRKIIKVVKDLL